MILSIVHLAQEGPRQQGKNKNPNSLLQSRRLPLDVKFLELHILSRGCQQLAGVTFTRMQTQTAPSCLWEGWKPDLTTRLFPSSLRLPVPFPRIQAMEKGLNKQRGRRGAGQGSGRGPEDPHFPSSLSPLPPKWLFLEGDLELCGGPTWFAKGGMQQTHTHVQSRLDAHTPSQVLGISWLSAWPGALCSWCSINGCWL